MKELDDRPTACAVCLKTFNSYFWEVICEKCFRTTHEECADAVLKNDGIKVICVECLEAL